MKKPSFFVVVFGDPALDGDPVESGVYTAGPRYPRFTVTPGDVLLLYCTEDYAKYSQQLPGIGIVLRLTQQQGFDSIEYRWLPLFQSIPRSSILQSFETEDSEKMRNLGVTAHRVFSISSKSFSDAISGQSLDWNKLSSSAG